MRITRRWRLHLLDKAGDGVGVERVNTKIVDALLRAQSRSGSGRAQFGEFPDVLSGVNRKTEAAQNFELRAFLVHFGYQIMRAARSGIGSQTFQQRVPGGIVGAARSDEIQSRVLIAGAKTDLT